MVAKQYYINRNGKIFGPYSKEAIRKAARQDKITFDDLISKSTRGPWITISLANEHSSTAKTPAIARQAEADEWLNDDLFGDFPDMPAVPKKPKKEKKSKSDDKVLGFFKKRKKSRNSIDYERAIVASPGQRLLAYIVDVLVSWVFFAPAMVVFFGLDLTVKPVPGEMPPGFDKFVTWMMIGGISYCVLQVYLQFVRAQSVGKWYCGLQIFDVTTMRPAGFFRNFVLRYIGSGLIVCIPFLGLIFGIADLFFIFRGDHRCLHDLVAGTQVMDISYCE